MDLLKAFDTVDQQIFVSKLQSYGVNGSNLRWYKNLDRSIAEQCNNNNTKSLPDIICSVLQGSIITSLLSLIYVNDLENASNILVPIIFADDTSYILITTLKYYLP